MAFWDIFKKKKTQTTQSPKDTKPKETQASQSPKDAKPKAAQASQSPKDANSKEDFFKMFFEAERQKAPSENFASGAVFDISRKFRDKFKTIVDSNNALQLNQFFSKAYLLFCSQPEIVGFTKNMVNTSLNDTELQEWNADIFKLENGDAAALCFMPIRNDTLDARVIGIILSDRGDGYYYCMLKKGENTASTVIRNKGIFGTSEIGQVAGRGFSLMNSFLNCIKADFAGNKDTKITL